MSDLVTASVSMEQNESVLQKMARRAKRSTYRGEFFMLLPLPLFFIYAQRKIPPPNLSPFHRANREAAKRELDKNVFITKTFLKCRR
jgi:hypothetical protein